MASNRRIIWTDRAPSALGPYSQAVVADGWVFCSGQIALDPASGEFVGGGIEAETRRVMANLGAVLEAAGSGFDRVVKTTIFLNDMADFAAVSAIYAESFGDEPPARATVAVGTLPKNVSVEIDAIALL